MNNENLIKEMAGDIHCAELRRRKCPYDTQRCCTGDCQYANAYYLCSYARMAEELINKGYCKQNEGVWISLEPEIGLFACSLCDHRILRAKCNYCPNCGAKMRDNEIIEELETLEDIQARKERTGL